MSVSRLMQMAAAGAAAVGGGALAIEDVFSTYLYTGNGSTQTITNGIDLAGEGGLVWIKWRSGSATPGANTDNIVVDTERGTSVYLETNSTSANKSATALSAFNSDGFITGGALTDVDNSGDKFASWTFRKAPRFFDVVTWTGAANQTIQHSLNAEPGCIIVKRVGASEDWWVYHRSVATDLKLNLTSAALGYSVISSVTNSSFNVNLNTTTSPDGYVAYLFAHDPLGPSGDGSDGLIACGSYVAPSDNSTVSIELGWEPQFFLVKKSSSTSDWVIIDNMRGMAVDSWQSLNANRSSAEETKAYQSVIPRATGVDIAWGNNAIHAGGDATHIYIAIRRGPMRQPESGTEVFAPITSQSATGTKLTTGFPVDMQIQKIRSQSGDNYLVSRLTGVGTLNQSGEKYLITNSTAAEASASLLTRSWDNTGYETPSGWNNFSTAYWNFRRAPGFFDVVAYTGNGVARTVQHNLGVAPEMIWVKGRSYAEGWPVYHTGTGNTDYTRINATSATVPSSAYWNNTTPTETEFSVGTVDRVNFSGATYIAYLFATLPGVSKVGSYTGNGSSQTIDCGFTSGARFILIKRTDSTGDWYVWDTTRGIVAANDPHLSLNTTAAEVTTNDSIDPDSSGFIVNQVAATNINVSSASYIYLAIA